MSKAQTRRRNQAQTARLEIVAQLYKRQHSYNQIRTEVMRRLNLKTYSLSTVHSDIQFLLSEWREQRLTDMEDVLQLELERIDDTCRELWEQWEASKKETVKQASKRKGTPSRAGSSSSGITTSSIETKTETTQRLGNPAYISEIREQLKERRKLLGLYAPEKKDVSGSLSFSQLLMETGMLDDAEAELNAQE